MMSGRSLLDDKIRASKMDLSSRTSVWKSDDRVTATDPASASPGRQIGVFAMSRVARRGRSVPIKTGNHLEGIGREARRAHPVVRQNSQVKPT
jgi:hypothetical protein